MKDLDYNLWEQDGVVRVTCYEVLDGNTATWQDPFFSEVLGDAFVDAYAEALGITDWAGIDEWFSSEEWQALTAPIFAKVFRLPEGNFAKLF